MKKDTSEFMEENVMDEAVYGEACQDTDSLSTYLTEIGRYKLLSNEEICELFQKIENGDRDAYNKVVTHNLKLVVKYAKVIKQSYKSNVPLTDLIQAGNIGLMRAVDKFEYKKGYAFSTYRCV